MTAQFHHQGLHRFGGLPVQQAPYFGRAGEGQNPHAGVGGPGLHDLGRLAGHDVEDTRRKARTFRQFGQRQRGERCFLGRVADHCAARRQRRARLAGQHRGGKVPRRDQRGHAHGFAPKLDLRIGQVAGHAFDIRALRLLGVEFQEIGGIVDFPPRLGQRLALFQDHDAGQIFLVLAHQVIPAADHRRTILGQRPRPRQKCRLCRVHCRCGVRPVQGRHITQPRPIRRVADGKRRACLTTGPLATDIGKRAHEARVRDLGQSGFRQGMVQRHG